MRAMPFSPLQCLCHFKALSKLYHSAGLLCSNLSHGAERNLSVIININFGDNLTAWTQANLPIRLGRLGIQGATECASFTFLASMSGSS